LQKLAGRDEPVEMMALRETGKKPSSASEPANSAVGAGRRPPAQRCEKVCGRGQFLAVIEAGIAILIEKTAAMHRIAGKMGNGKPRLVAVR
jgi:hypothetical protein